ncbi:hypothetical protein ACFVUH_13725 [Kitasatospora sp. NPDC058032]|uniref:hypothetical protein n=1 Tax=Kitasatospora sp. NPDC058032 TaxID=3346307 RepID=UPI0036DA4754
MSENSTPSIPAARVCCRSATVTSTPFGCPEGSVFARESTFAASDLPDSDADSTDIAPGPGHTASGVFSVAVEARRARFSRPIGAVFTGTGRVC